MAAGASEQSRRVEPSLRVRSANDCAPIGKHKKRQKKAEPLSLTPGNSRDVDVLPNNPWLCLGSAPLADSEDRTPAICMCLLGCYDAMSKNLGHKAVAWGMREGGVGKTHVPLLNPVSLC